MHMKRVVAPATATAVVLGAAVVMPMPAQAAVPAPAAHYPLASDLTDVIGGANGTATGTVGYADGLTLTGGASGPYATLPSSVISGRGEDMTISVWVKRTQAAGNTSAMFFGTPPVSGLPTNYWILNPASPGSYFKSVFTNSDNAAQPWTTEVGPSAAANSVSTSAYRNVWANYTTVITATTIQGFLNGEPVGPAVAKTKTIANFAGALSVFLGRSNYTADSRFGGSLRDLKIYEDALTQEQIAEAYDADLEAPDAAPSAVTASLAGTDVTVSWAAATGGSGFRPVEGYLVSLTPAGGGTAITAEVDAATTTTTFDEVADGTYTVSVAATNSAGTGPATQAAEPVVVDGDASLEGQDLAALTIPNADDVRGNITLPLVGPVNGSAITWTADPVGVVTTSANGEIAAGVVTRGATDRQVVLTAHAGDESRDITITVKAAAETEEYAAYLFTYFNGEGGPAGESVRLAVSKGDDALEWNDLNNGNAVLTSTMGTLGVRDPFIIRSHEGDKFYLLATDLNTSDIGFGEAQISGSKYLEIWESTDLVNWSAQRHIKVSSDYAGNTWAPEAFWDDTLGAYVVYWASNLYDTTEIEGRDNTESYNRMMYSTTRDFVTFTEPEIWMDTERREGGFGMIDSSVIKSGDTFYRFTKEEGPMRVLLQKSDTLRADQVLPGIGADFPTDAAANDWDLVVKDIGVNQSYVNPAGNVSTFSSGEGPTIFGSITDPDQWYLFIDQPSYHGGQGYAAMTSTDKGATWTVLDSSGLPDSPRHGTVIGITRAEYDRLVAAYQPNLSVASVATTQVSVEAGSTAKVELPESVQVTFGAGGGTAAVEVDWDEVDLSGLDSAGDVVEVRGALANGSATPAIARITAVAPGAGTGTLTLTADRSAIRVGDTERIGFVSSGGDVPAAAAWTSSAPAVATVSGDGTVTGVAAGTATITATDGARTATYVIEVVAAQADLLLRYDFDMVTATAAGTSIPDTSGLGKDGTVVGSGAGTVTRPTEGGDSQALSLPGGAAGSGAAWVGIPADVIPDGTQDATMALWVNSTNVRACEWAAALGEQRSRNAYLFTSTRCPSNARSGIKVGATENLAGGPAIAASTWTHVAVVLDGGTSLTYYVNGVQAATQTTTHGADALRAAASEFGGALGKSFYVADPFYGGAVDDFRVYGAALTAAQIAEVMAGDPQAPALDLTVTASTRCVAGKVVLTAKVTNPNAAAVAVELESAYGSKAIATLAPGKSVSQAFSSRLAAVPAGAVTATATATVDGEEVTGTAEAPYAAASCS